MCQTPDHLYSPPLNNLQESFFFPELRNPVLDTALQMRPHQKCRINHQPQLAGNVFPIAPQGNRYPGIPQNTIVLLGHRGTAGTRTASCLSAPSLQSCFPAGQSPACAGAWGYPSQGAGSWIGLCWISNVPLQPVETVLYSHKVLWGTGHPSRCSVPSSKSLMNKLNNTGH